MSGKYFYANTAKLKYFPPGHTYDISNKHRLGYSEVQLVQVMIDAVNTLWKEDLEFQKKHNITL